ncbi:MAG: alpha/beta fold hydrolase, partial [Dehalococcoidia bacterium]|nr:alpha/beta fold hydrolase [Dehalococcoidia bacterium]
VTSEPLGRVYVDGWTPDGQRLVLNGNDDDDNFIAVFDLRTREMTKLFTSERWLENSDFSEDGLMVAIAVPRNADDPEDHDIAVFELDDPSELRWISTGEGHRDDDPLWSPDSALLAFTAEIGDTTNLVIYDGAALKEIARKEIEADVLSLRYWSPDSDFLDLIVERHGRNSFWRAHLEGSDIRLVDRSDLSEGSIHTAHRDGERVAVTSSAINRPQTGLQLLDLDGNEVAELDLVHLELPLGTPRSVWLQSRDGAQIQAWVVRTGNDDEVQPGLVYVHGGPTMASKDTWRRDMQAMVLSGFTVIAPNFRGSTGFGPEFRKANILDVGGKDLEDCIAAAEWLRKQPGIDRERIGITGGSYGGYMVLQALTTSPDTFAVGAGTVPVADWIQDYELADASFRYYDVYFFGGAPDEKPDLYRERSPITHIQKLKAPLFISAGRNDSRCPFPPIEHFVEKGWELGKEIEFNVQESEGHGAARKTAAIDTELKLLQFLRRRLAVA